MTKKAFSIYLSITVLLIIFATYFYFSFMWTNILYHSSGILIVKSSYLRNIYKAVNESDSRGSLSMTSNPDGTELLIQNRKKDYALVVKESGEIAKIKIPWRNVWLDKSYNILAETDKSNFQFKGGTISKKYNMCSQHWYQNVNFASYLLLCPKNCQECLFINLASPMPQRKKCANLGEYLMQRGSIFITVNVNFDPDLELFCLTIDYYHSDTGAHYSSKQITFQSNQLTLKPRQIDDLIASKDLSKISFTCKYDMPVSGKSTYCLDIDSGKIEHINTSYYSFPFSAFITSRLYQVISTLLDI